MELKQVGVTECGMMVVSGIFKLLDTHGLPFEIVFMKLKEENTIPGSIELIDECLLAGWSYKTILKKLRDPYVDVYGIDHWNAIDNYINLRQNKEKLA